jgi:hypothetical protein
LAIIAKLTVCYNKAEGRQPIGFYEYLIANDVTRYVPIYEESDRIKAKQIRQKSWDGLDEKEEEEVDG